MNFSGFCVVHCTVYDIIQQYAPGNDRLYCFTIVAVGCASKNLDSGKVRRNFYYTTGAIHSAGGAPPTIENVIMIIS